MAFKDTFEAAEEQDQFWTELAILDFTSQLNHLMQQQKISKVELAKRLGTSPAYITKVFRGDANFTLRSMVKLARALGGSFTPNVIVETSPAATESNVIPFPGMIYKTASNETIIANYGR